MKTKSGKEVEILGQIHVNGHVHYISKLQSPLYIVDSSTLTKYILIPATEFNLDNGIPYAEIVQ